MPYKTRRRRIGSGNYDLDLLRKQSFREWWGLCCGNWLRESRTINSRSAMLQWYSANRQEFDQIHLPPKFGSGHRPGERHAGWWFTVGFPEFGPRLLVNPEQTEQRIGRILDGHWLPGDSFHGDSDRLITRWKAGRMPSKPALREHISFTPAMRDFPDGFESSIEYLERHKLLTADEESLLFEESL